MAIFQIEYRSDILDMERNMNVILPDKRRLDKDETLDDIPVLYLLHGMSGNHNSWMKRTGIERLLRYTKLAVVMPSTDMAWYTNTQYGMNYYDALTVELLSVVHEFFPRLSTKREKTFIAGNSMGGYGAFKLAFLSNKFSYAASLSGALSFHGLHLEDIAPQQYWCGIFGDSSYYEHHLDNLLVGAKKQAMMNETLPKLYAWCGKQDIVYDSNIYASNEIKKLGYDLIFEVEEGSHEWYYWEKKLETILHWLPIKYVEEERMI